jgi:hypothetical protein
MKNLLLILFSFCCLITNASTTYTLRGTTYQVDTLYHSMIGPGTSQTSLLIHNTNRTMRAFYSTIDLTNPYITLKTVMANDKIATTETVSAMSQRKSKPGARYFLGVNSDFFVTSGTTNRGETLVGEPIGSCMADGNIYRNQNDGYFTQFVINSNKEPRIGNIVFSGTVVNSSGQSIPLGGINAEASSDQITLYNSNWFKSTNQLNDECEVTAKLADGESFAYGKPFKLVITGTPSTEKDILIPDSSYVIHGEGTTTISGTNAKKFVADLKPGDIVTATFHASVNGSEFYPVEMASSFPKSVDNGQTTETEWMLEEFGSNQPVCAMGIANSGKTIIFIVVDGRSPLSTGCRTTEIGDLMRCLGVTDALSFDSGGSATFYTTPLGIRNRPSDGVERGVGNATFAVSSAPDDDNIASLGFIDWKLVSPKYGIYTPHFYGYNKYGTLINTDVKGVKLSCPATLGHIKNDSTFIGDGSGTDMLTGTYNGITVSAPMSIEGSGEGIALTNDSVINDTYRSYAVDVQSVVNEKIMKVDPAALTWSTADASIVTIDPNTGVLKGLVDGETTVTGTVGNFTDTMKVKVQKPTARVMPVDPGLDISTWKLTLSGGTNTAATVQGNGIKVTYTGAAARTYTMKLTKNVTVWSLPDTLRIRLNPGDAVVKSLIFSVRTNGGHINYQTITPDSIPANKETVIDLPTASWCDAESMSSYPIQLSSIQLNMGAPTSGNSYTVLFNGIEAVYKNVPVSGINGVNAGPDLKITAHNGVIYFSSTVDEATLYNITGAQIKSVKKATSLNVNSTGVFIITAKVGGKVVTRKVIL